MKILNMNYEYPPVGGGGASVAQSLAESMVCLGHEVDVITSGMKDLPDFEIVNGVRIHRVKCIRRQRHYSTAPELLTQVFPAYKKALELSAQKKFDINHTHFIVPSAISSYLLKKKTGLPYIITAHGSDVPGYNPDRFELIHKMINPFWRKLLTNSDAVTSPSNYLNGLIQQQINIEVDIIPNSYDMPDGATAERKNRILVASRLVERKGVQYLIQAMENFNQEWEVCIAGDGPYLSTLKNLASTINMPIHFAGFVSHEKMRELYHSAKIFVFPSTQENFPMVLLEGMSAGCAIVATSIAGNCEVVGNAAIRIEPKNVKSTRDALTRLTRDEGLIKHHRELSLERVKNFTNSRITNMYLDLYKRVIASDNSL